MKTTLNLNDQLLADAKALRRCRGGSARRYSRAAVGWWLVWAP